MIAVTARFAALTPVRVVQATADSDATQDIDTLDGTDASSIPEPPPAAIVTVALAFCCPGDARVRTCATTLTPGGLERVAGSPWRMHDHGELLSGGVPVMAHDRCLPTASITEWVAARVAELAGRDGQFPVGTELPDGGPGPWQSVERHDNGVRAAQTSDPEGGDRPLVLLHPHAVVDPAMLSTLLKAMLPPSIAARVLAIDFDGLVAHADPVFGCRSHFTVPHIARTAARLLAVNHRAETSPYFAAPYCAREPRHSRLSYAASAEPHEWRLRVRAESLAPVTVEREGAIATALGATDFAARADATALLNVFRALQPRGLLYTAVMAAVDADAAAFDAGVQDEEPAATAPFESDGAPSSRLPPAAAVLALDDVVLTEFAAIAAEDGSDSSGDGSSPS